MSNSIWKPKRFYDFYGQKNLKAILKIIVKSAIKQSKCIDHCLFFGPPGHGKTTLATIIANELKTNIKITQGSLLEKKADFLTLFASIEANDVIFIDEFHSINKTLEELLYSVLDENVIDLFIGVEGESKPMRMKLPPFTLLAATTKISKISIPIKERFGLVAKFEKYTTTELQKILNNQASKQKLLISQSALGLIANYSLATPRIALNYLNRVSDYAIAKSENSISEQIVLKVFKLLGLYQYGLNNYHIEYLNYLKNSQNALSLDSLARLLNDSRTNIENFLEPILLKKSLIVITNQGRKLTSFGLQYLQKLD